MTAYFTDYYDTYSGRAQELRSWPVIRTIWPLLKTTLRLNQSSMQLAINRQYHSYGTHINNSILRIHPHVHVRTYAFASGTGANNHSLQNSET